MANTAKIGSYKTVAEYSVAAGVRRIDAVVGLKAVELLNAEANLNRTAAEALKTAPSELLNKVQQTQTEMKDMRRTIEQLRSRIIKTDTERLIGCARQVGRFKVITAYLREADSDWLRTAGDFLKDREPNVVAVLATTAGDKITFLAVCGREAVNGGIKAGEIIKTITKIADGSGGGKPDVAMGGGRNLLKLDDALAAVDDFVSQKV